MFKGEALPERMQGSALFTGISGFTPMTEAPGSALQSRPNASRSSVSAAFS